MPAGLKPSIAPPEGVFISGLQLHNALWDNTRAVLMMPSSDSIGLQEMPVFWLKPLDTYAPQTPRRLYELYRCPVYCSQDTKKHGDKNVIVHFSLPTENDPSVWQYQRAFLTTNISKAT
jgi:hypothetical protein